MSTIPSPEVMQELQKNINLILDQTRALILSSIKSGFNFQEKLDKSIVTEVDVSVEKLFRSQISNLYPDHGIIGEELPGENLSQDFCWVIDPIDGTTNFSLGVPTFGTIIGLYYRGEEILGAIDHPCQDYRVVGARGVGTFFNGQKVLLTEKSIIPAQSVIFLGDLTAVSRVIKEKFSSFILKNSPKSRIYSDCFGHTLTITNKLSGGINCGLKLWDITGAKVLVEEAGGAFYLINDGIQSSPTKNLDELVKRSYHVIFGKKSMVDYLIQELELKVYN